MQCVGQHCALCVRRLHAACRLNTAHAVYIFPSRKSLQDQTELHSVVSHMQEEVEVEVEEEVDEDDEEMEADDVDLDDDDEAWGDPA